MAGRILTDDGGRALDDDGNPISGAKRKAFLAGTSTPASLYTTSALSVAHANPVVADADGRYAQMWADETVLLDIKEYAAADTSYVTPLRTFLSVTPQGPGSGNFTQAGSGAITRTTQEKARDIVSVADFGVDTDASIATNTAAIIAAEVYARSIGAKLMGVPGTYTVNATIPINCDCDMGMMVIEADGASVSPVIRCGTVSGDPIERKIMILPRVRNNARTSGVWGSGTGIELANAHSCDFTIPSSTEFAVGLTCGGYNSGFVSNTLNLGYIYSNKVGLQLSMPGSAGWCNQNQFIGGRIGFNTSDFTTSLYVGTRMIKIAKGSTSQGGPNGNTFIGTSIESDLVQYSIEFNESADSNLFINLRFEGSGAVNVLFTTATAGGITANLFIGGYDAYQIVPTYSGAGTSLYNSMIAGRAYSIEGEGALMNLSNQSGSAFPHLQGFAAGVNVIGKTDADTNWLYRLLIGAFHGKAAADDHPRLKIEWSSGLPKFTFGVGSSAPDVVWTLGAGTPEAAVTSSPGGLYLNLSGGAGTTLYVKESGTATNTGWVAK